MRYSRKLSAGKLFKIQSRCAAPPNPRRESARSSYAPQQPADASRHNRDASQHRQLFDPRKHDTVSFSSAQARKPAQKISTRLLEALGNIARYHIITAAMVPSAPQVSSSLITATVNGSLRTSPVGFVPEKPKMLRGSWQRRPTSLHARPLNSDFDAPMPSRALEVPLGNNPNDVFLDNSSLTNDDEFQPEPTSSSAIERMVDKTDDESDTELPPKKKTKTTKELVRVAVQVSSNAGSGEFGGINRHIRSRPLESPSLPVWSPSAQARWSAPDACALELFILLYDMLFTNIQLDDFSPTLARLLERLTIEEPELNRNPAATVAAAKVKLARKAHTTKMEVNGDERRWSNDMGGLNTQGPSIDATASQEPPFVFKMAQELTFSMLAHILRFPWERERAASVAATDTQHAELVEKIQHWDGPTVEAYVDLASLTLSTNTQLASTMIHWFSSIVTKLLITLIKGGWDTVSPNAGVIYAGLQKLNTQNEPATPPQTETDDSNFSTIDNMDANLDSKIESENNTNGGVGDVKGSKYEDD
ncbi:hypothetical protein V8E52_011684 [Russula decolorans]